jgi:L-lactate dehydrogenase complex protein LldE
MIQLKNSSPPEWEYPKYQPGEPVALFVPCYTEEFYAEAAEATVKLLQKYDIPVVYPKEQTCCGQPSFNSGYWEETKKVVHHFCDCFEPYKWIIGPTGSCTAMCRVFFEHVDPDPRVVEIGRRVFELSEFLIEALGVTDTEARFPHKVTMHVGCHTRRELGVADGPLTLLKNIRDIEYCELPDMAECCGFGGTFSVKMPGTSLSMGETKVENVLKSGADILCSTDSSCLMHIEGMLRRHPEGSRIQCKHLAELLIADE